MQLGLFFLAGFGWLGLGWVPFEDFRSKLLSVGSGRNRIGKPPFCESEGTPLGVKIWDEQAIHIN